MNRKTYKYHSVLESEGRMYADVKSLLTEIDLEKRKLFNIMLAISEAFTNALIHGNCFDPDKMVEVAITINDEAMIADIIDEGNGFNQELLSPDYPDLLSEGGRGVGLMKSIADEIVIERNGRTGGTQITMRFDLKKNKTKKKSMNDLEDKMEMIKKDEGNVMILTLSGRLDLSSGNRLKEEVKSILSEGRTSIHLNLKEVEFVNSSGLGALVSIMKEIRIHRGRLTLSDMADYVREIFDITQLSHIFEIFATEVEALHSYHLVPSN
jgi:anti-anti-sigma factor